MSYATRVRQFRYWWYQRHYGDADRNRECIRTIVEEMRIARGA